MKTKEIDRESGVGVGRGKKVIKRMGNRACVFQIVHRRILLFSPFPIILSSH